CGAPPAAGADAVHPGYGFLSENADFATAVQAAGLTWIGPPASAVAAMGSKIEAKKIMAAAGVPVLDELDPESVTADMLPVLIKASAGGGGRGMRVVRELADLPAQVDAARREAQSAFGDPEVFCERYLAAGHHIEVQVMADAHGTVWAVGERECSIQRRHQKIIEEAPSPLVERVAGMRDKLFEAARLAASAIGYTGAGTVEFMAGGHAEADGDFFFLEMNTRLQVEHPVTELTTGLDLVELQLDIADGAALDPQPPPARGAAIEARLYAEDPAKNWQPQAGTVHRFSVPTAVTEFGPIERLGVRVDSGIVDDSVISVFYDPMIAKVISYAPTRGQAASLLADALLRTRIHGVRTNRDLLVNVLRRQAFLDGATDTAFFDTHGLAELAGPVADEHTTELAAVAAALADAAHNRDTASVFPGIPSGWRNLASGLQSKRYDDDAGRTHDIRYRFDRDGVHLEGSHNISEVTLVSATPQRVVLADGAVEHPFTVARYHDTVFVDSPAGSVRLTALPRYPDPADALAHGSLLAPMPGSVLRVGAAVGDRVTAGQPLIWLEAMKMEHTIAAPGNGVLVELHVEPGRQVEVGAVLARVDNPEGETP
ncbi:MAG: biotin/lipoyl-containing protein, partial [Actinomycetota bacterium]|nr:biotin/lipoyl-containing protein [Actinomycetota bacterium]